MRRNDILSRTVAFKPIFLEVDNDPMTALFLSQSYYYQRQADRQDTSFGDVDDDGNVWFWKRQDDFESETGLNRYRQDKAREALREMPWWHESKRGMPCKLYFRIDVRELKRWVIRKDDDIDCLGNSTNQGCRGSTNKDDDGRQTDAPAHNAPASRSQTTTQIEREAGTHTSAREDQSPPDDQTPDASSDVDDVSGTVWADEYGLDAKPKHDWVWPQRIQHLWRKHVDPTTDPLSGDPGRLRHAKHVGAFFDEEAIVELLKVTGRKASKGRKWSYFMACLERAADDKTGGSTDEGEDLLKSVEEWGDYVE